MKRSVETKSNCASMVLAFMVAVSIGTTAMGAEVLRVELAERRIQPGVRTVIVSVYAAPEGGEPMATETRSVRIGDRGTFNVPLGDLAAAVSGAETRWLAVRVTPGKESRRVPLTPSAAKRDVAVQAVTPAAITAFGLIESTVQGFRFPDGTVQTSAATVSGGVPSVNGIGGAVTIAGAGTATVQTAGSTVTVTTPAFGTPVAIGAASSAGVANTIVRSDHVHAHGDQAGGTLHASATTGSAGFLSATDKEKLDGAAAYVRTIVVSPVVGNATASGTALINALSGISGNSATNPFLLKIEPGIYDLGASALTMKPNVDIEGSGENTTFIVASRGSTTNNVSAAAIVSAASAELRQLTVSNTAPGTIVGMAFFSGSLATRLTHVTLNSTGATGTSMGLFATFNTTLSVDRATIMATATGGTSGATGIHFSTGAKVSVLNSRVTATGVGGTGTNAGVSVIDVDAVATINGCTIIATGTGSANNGVTVGNGTATITNSTLQADTNSVRSALFTGTSSTSVAHVSHSRLLAFSTTSSQKSVTRGSNSTVRVATSEIDSPSTGTPKCVHVYDDEMNDLNNVCPTP